MQYGATTHPWRHCVAIGGSLVALVVGLGARRVAVVWLAALAVRLEKGELHRANQLRLRSGEASVDMRGEGEGEGGDEREVHGVGVRIVVRQRKRGEVLELICVASGVERSVQLKGSVFRER